MDDLSRKLKAFDWKGLQRQAKKVQASTASALKDLVMTDLENKVRAATGDTNWGANGADLAEIAQGTYNREDFTLIMSIIWQRLASTRWRCVYKALDVLKYLVLHGASRVVEETREALPHIRRLEHFAFVDPATRRDEGANVRARASAFVAILQDDALLEEERTKSAALRAKIGIAVPSSHYTAGAGAGGGLSSDDYRFGAATNAATTGTSGGYDDAPVRKMTNTSAATFDGYGVADSPPAASMPGAGAGVNASAGGVNATIDDLLGGFDAAPALPAPNNKSSFGLADLMAGSPPPASAPSNGVNGANAKHMAPLGLDDDDDDDDFDESSLTAPPQPAPAPMSTSRLVANLAAARSNAAEAQARTDAAVTPLSAMQAAASAENVQPKPAEDVAYGGLVHFENLMLDKSTRVESKPLANAKPMPAPAAAPAPQPATGVDVDPFGDLLSTAKKTGVL